jgi:hypothetical protein
METNTVIYYCTRCGSCREAPANLPLMCCGELMEQVNQEAGRRMMQDGQALGTAILQQPHMETHTQAKAA